jgi:hypothetical protein
MLKEMTSKSGTSHFGPTQPQLATAKQIGETGDHPRLYPLTKLFGDAIIRRPAQRDTSAVKPTQTFTKDRCYPTNIVRERKWRKGNLRDKWEMQDRKFEVVTESGGTPPSGHH